jgi:hypothetical protein
LAALLTASSLSIIISRSRLLLLLLLDLFLIDAEEVLLIPREQRRAFPFGTDSARNLAPVVGPNLEHGFGPRRVLMGDPNSEDHSETLTRPGAPLEISELGQTVPATYTENTSANQEVEAGRSPPLGEVGGTEIPVASIETLIVVEHRAEEVTPLARRFECSPRASVPRLDTVVTDGAWGKLDSSKSVFHFVRC